MTVHLLGLAHSETTDEFAHCAYTQRTRDFATLLARAGVPVVLYGGERDASEAHHVPLVTREEQRAFWPDYVPGRDVFNDFHPMSIGQAVFNTRAAAAIRERAEPHDVVAFTMGTAQQPAWGLLERDDLLPVETGIGYAGVWAPYRVFESWAWRSYLAGRGPSDQARLFDAVIPRAYDAADFPAGDGQGGYFAFVGRLIQRKGPSIAADACRRLGARLVVAGQGVASVEPGKITCDDGTTLTGDVEYAGLVGPAERAELMGGAMAVFAPTLYLEPFGGVSVEAQLCGTPAIVAAWGGLVENVTGATGFACATLAEFADAAARAPELDRATVREHALATWTLEALTTPWLDHLARLDTLWTDGWYA